MKEEYRGDRKLSKIHMASEGSAGCAGCGLGCLSVFLFIVSIPSAIWVL
ncbi:hypothetical protein LCM20_16940 [Halobacillus litoralis]|nr:hypothetical protein [Halobacillus litoralis]MCA0972296.1 hypothetical protein [Halobacillus litoralis]